MNFVVSSAARKVLPAYAGMILRERRLSREEESAPRVCGDDPYFTEGQIHLNSCSPRMRG